MASIEPETSDRTQRTRAAIDTAVTRARDNHDGVAATYCPDLADAPLEATSCAVMFSDGTSLAGGDADWHRLTLQSVSKVVLLAALLEEWGEERVFSVVGPEPSGASFDSLAQLERHGGLPANPLINAGAIALCGQLGGTVAEQRCWAQEWGARLCERTLPVSWQCHAGEQATGHHNRSMAYFLKAHGMLPRKVEDTVDTYFVFCSLIATVQDAAAMAGILARGGWNTKGEQVLSHRTVTSVVSLMATCGMYDESGRHLLNTGLPAKSGVSGLIVAVAPGRGGLAVASPRLNPKGGSIRGHIMLTELSQHLGWHFAHPRL